MGAVKHLLQNDKERGASWKVIGLVEFVILWNLISSAEPSFNRMFSMDKWSSYLPSYPKQDGILPFTPTTKLKRYLATELSLLSCLFKVAMNGMFPDIADIWLEKDQILFLNLEVSLAFLVACNSGN